MQKVIELRNTLNKQFPNSYELNVGAKNSAVIRIVSDSFKNQSRKERLERVEPLLRQAGLQPCFTELYTSEEAEERGVTLDTAPPCVPSSWHEAAQMVASGQSFRDRTREHSQRKPHRIVFYSYKGGVGRTTALAHTAFHLARGGARVAVADMDVEAPGLHTVLPPPDGHTITAGLVDYLWERQTIPFDTEAGETPNTCLVALGPGSRTAISYSVEDPVSRAQIQVIPAGMVGPDYVQRLHTLSQREVLTRPDDAWTLFEKELLEQLAPDILLIDARTGLGDWGGLSLLRLADEAVLVVFPSEQNIEGLKYVRQTLLDLTGISTHIVLSPVPEGIIGRELVSRFLPLLGLEEDEQRVDIHYSPGIASATRYPVESAMPVYARLANLIQETGVESNLEDMIKTADRWQIIESLKFPERNAKDIAAGSFDAFFQRTSDFDMFLDDARWVVRGRKGTGKSTLFHLFTEHQANAVQRANGKLEQIIILAGHGPAAGSRFRPTTDEFASIQRKIEKDGYDWLSLWRAYAIIRIFTSEQGTLLDPILRGASMKRLRSHLQSRFGNPVPEAWRSEHTAALLALLKDPLNGSCRDLMGDLNKALRIDGKKLWLLYDDLDQDISETSPWQGEALGGLLRLAYDANNQDFHNIRFKVFLREDIWNKLVFTNKSHFGEARTLLLQWKIEDCLRLAYRLAAGGSKEFHALAQRHFPLSSAEVDTANEEQLRKVLAPLWGLHQAKGQNAFVARWVYSRMTDAKDNTYPRSLAVLLQTARDQELKNKGGSKPVSANRLLGQPAMVSGLAAASVERVNALKNEYPNLVAFLEDLQNNKSLRSQFMAVELEEAWRKTSMEAFDSFESFAAQLESAGLITKKKRGKAYDYGIANLYIDGLGANRVQGERK